jgi:hypothetical protein
MIEFGGRRRGLLPAGKIMLPTISLFLLSTKMVRYSISIQPPLSPHGFNSRTLSPGRIFNVRDFDNGKIKKAEDACCRQQDQMLFSGVTPAPMCKF